MREKTAFFRDRRLAALMKCLLLAGAVLPNNTSAHPISGKVAFEKNAAAWQPPIGIPMPSFGVFETISLYAGQIDSATDTVLRYHASSSGIYTHYVDNTSPAATDKNNPYGTQNMPRKTLPLDTLQPGSIVEIHGGPYQMGYTVLASSGTPDKPIFLRGESASNRPVFARGSFYIGAHYVIVENIRFDTGCAVNIRPVYAANDAHHVAVRYCESAVQMSAVSYLSGKKSHNVLFLRNSFSGNEFDTTRNSPRFPEDDICGIYLGVGSDSVWILDNDICGFKGDAVGGGHGANYTTSNYFIGRNKLHHCGENGIDIKEVQTVVVSQNRLYGFYGRSTGSNGTATVVHYGPTVSPRNVWFLFNEIFDCSDNGIQVGGAQMYDVYYIGNIVRDIHNDSNKANGYTTWDSRRVYLVGNLFYNVDNGIKSAVEGDTTQLVFADNIISTVSPAGFHLSVTGSQQVKNDSVSYNLFCQPQGGLKILWGGAPYTSLADFQRATDKGERCLQADPLFSDTAKRDFTLRNGSTAVQAGIAHPVYDLFKSLFGISIDVDFNGAPRPSDRPWDIGPFQRTPGSIIKGQTVKSGRQPVRIRQINSSLCLSFQSSCREKALCTIHNVKGQVIARRFIDLGPGINNVRWESRERVSAPRAGLFFVNIESASLHVTRGFVLPAHFGIAGP